jgi:hypothetical protein
MLDALDQTGQTDNTRVICEIGDNAHRWSAVLMAASMRCRACKARHARMAMGLAKIIGYRVCPQRSCIYTCIYAMKGMRR